MTLVQASFFSENLNRQVYYNAMIPTTQQPLRTLYILHGWSGSHDDWIKRTRVLGLAEKYHIAIIFPNGENSFYVDFSEAESYGKMVAEDLVLKLGSYLISPINEKILGLLVYRWEVMGLYD